MLAAFLLGLLASPASARTFRWANDEDAASLDPYARQETFLLSFDSNIYEPLIRRAPDLTLEPALATQWIETDPTTWRMKLRAGVSFQDGSPFSADDVIFSFERVRAPGSALAASVASVKELRKIDALTIEFVTTVPDPILPEEITNWDMMSKAWCESHDATHPSSSDESFATDHANGTGPFMVKERAPRLRTVLIPNPRWWDERRDNLDEVVFRPISDGEARVAALLAGKLDMIYAVPPDATERIARSTSARLIEGPELRTIFLGFDQSRDELLESNIRGRNPFRDWRVRRAFYQAIDEEAIRTRVMQGFAIPAALLVAPGINGFDPTLDERIPFDPAAARALLAEAGFGQGFETGMDCPTDRYVNDEAICQAVVAMLAKVGIRVKLLAQPRADYFAKITGPGFTTSFYLQGWAPDTYDALNVLVNLVETRDEKTGAGDANLGGYSNPELDALIGRVERETDAVRRHSLLREALKLAKDDIAYIPLHQQAVVWAARTTIELAQPADNSFMLRTVRMK